MNLDLELPKIDNNCDVLPTNGKHGLCRAYYQPDEFDIKTIEYAKLLSQQSKNDLYALDLGCSPYFPQSQRLAKLGFHVDAFDLEKPMADFEKINKLYNNFITYQTKNLADLKSSDLRTNYQIVYSNRCLSFLSYPQTFELIRTLIGHINIKTRYFLAFFLEGAKYAENYPMDVPLEKRYIPLDNSTARKDQMLAPVCIYKREEIFEKLLGGLPIHIMEVLQAKSGSLKIIFETT